jgi:hypothetical protein
MSPAGPGHGLVVFFSSIVVVLNRFKTEANLIRKCDTAKQKNGPKRAGQCAASPWQPLDTLYIGNIADIGALLWQIKAIKREIMLNYSPKKLIFAYYTLGTITTTLT